MCWQWMCSLQKIDETLNLLAAGRLPVSHTHRQFTSEVLSTVLTHCSQCMWMLKTTAWCSVTQHGPISAQLWNCRHPLYTHGSCPQQPVRDSGEQSCSYRFPILWTAFLPLCTSQSHRTYSRMAYRLMKIGLKCKHVSMLPTWQGRITCNVNWTLHSWWQAAGHSH